MNLYSTLNSHFLYQCHMSFATGLPLQPPEAVLNLSIVLEEVTLSQFMTSYTILCVNTLFWLAGYKCLSSVCILKQISMLSQLSPLTKPLSWYYIQTRWLHPEALSHSAVITSSDLERGPMMSSPGGWRWGHTHTSIHELCIVVL